MSRQAVVILHGMGEQIPMQTLNSFVRAVWTTDPSLVANPTDPRTGQARTENASWAKPDARNSSSELRRITTEADRNGDYTDFFEFYWAHLMRGTTLDHVRVWIWDLLLRNPFRRVPRRVIHAWAALWIVAVLVLAAIVSGLLPADAPPRPAARILVGWVIGLGAAAFVSNVLIKRIGDVARYVEARPPNVARRQEIRAEGVDLLDRLMTSGDYDRIVVVAHSLGTIVAYDILSMLFARHNTLADDRAPQPERHALEEMARRAAGLPTAKGQTCPPRPLDVDRFQAQQAAALAEAQAQGSPWLITDFVTLGSPLSHAEFLIADGLADLRARQNARLLPTCPPVMEFDGTTKLWHFSYDPAQARNRHPDLGRKLHHAAPFALTRWTNLYSQELGLITGDIASGPVAPVFGPATEGVVVTGIRDIAVLPRLECGRPAKGHRRRFITHRHYWSLDKGSERTPAAVPHHIAELRKALGLLR